MKTQRMTSNKGRCKCVCFWRVAFLIRLPMRLFQTIFFPSSSIMLFLSWYHVTCCLWDKLSINFDCIRREPFEHTCHMHLQIYKTFFRRINKTVGNVRLTSHYGYKSNQAFIVNIKIKWYISYLGRVGEIQQGLKKMLMSAWMFLNKITYAANL